MWFVFSLTSQYISRNIGLCFYKDQMMSNLLCFSYCTQKAGLKCMFSMFSLSSLSEPPRLANCINIRDPFYLEICNRFIIGKVTKFSHLFPSTFAENFILFLINDFIIFIIIFIEDKSTLILQGISRHFSLLLVHFPTGSVL